MSEVADRVFRLEQLLLKIRPIREEWLGEGRRATPGHVGEIESLPCDSYEKLVKAWRKAMRWGPELDGFLTISLASVMSVDRVGHGQLWFKAIGPPSCGKSTIAEAFAVNKNHVIARSTFGNTGIVSAYQVDKEGTEDKSLMEKIKGKLLFVKDGDTLLKAANRDKILSQLRDAFDKVIRTTAGNEMSRDYEGYAFCVGICGTKMLRELDTSELGQRFIDYVIFDEINEDDEDAVGWNVANQSSMEMAYKYDGKMESQDSPEKVLAKRLTAGYIDHLRATNDEVFSRMDMAEPDLRYAQTLAKFTAFMRARPNDNKKVEGEAGRELSYRLIAQFVRLAKSIAGVWNKHFVDDEVMHLVRKVALDTSRGKTLEMVRHLYREGQQGFFPEGLASWTQDDTETTAKLLRFLRRIKAVETWVKPTPGVKKPRPRWRLTERMRALYHAVMGDEAHA